MGSRSLTRRRNGEVAIVGKRNRRTESSFANRQHNAVGEKVGGSQGGRLRTTGHFLWSAVAAGEILQKTRPGRGGGAVFWASQSRGANLAQNFYCREVSCARRFVRRCKSEELGRGGPAGFRGGLLASQREPPNSRARRGDLLGAFLWFQDQFAWIGRHSLGGESSSMEGKRKTSHTRSAESNRRTTGRYTAASARSRPRSGITDQIRANAKAERESF